MNQQLFIIMFSHFELNSFLNVRVEFFPSFMFYITVTDSYLGSDALQTKQWMEINHNWSLKICTNSDFPARGDTLHSVWPWFLWHILCAWWQPGCLVTLALHLFKYTCIYLSEMLWQWEEWTFLRVEAAAQLSQVSLINIHLCCLSFSPLNYSLDRHMEVTAENNLALCLLCSLFFPWRLKLTPTWQIASL